MTTIELIEKLQEIIELHPATANKHIYVKFDIVTTVDIVEVKMSPWKNSDSVFNNSINIII
jgi:hypothetical protein